MKFDEVGLPSGVARDPLGSANGSMGVDAGDEVGSGLASLWVTNYEHEHHALYRNLGNARFEHVTIASGLGFLGTLSVGWGTGFIDLDNDGWEDLVVIQGGLSVEGEKPQQRAVLAINDGEGRFRDVTGKGGTYFQGPHFGRGLALGDLNNDGRCDLVVTNLNEPTAILRNDCPNGNHWIGVELATKDHGDVVGAVAELERAGRTLTRFAKGGGSYLSSSDRRLLFGLGKDKRPARLTVHWPSGEPRTQVWEDLPIDRYHRLVQGEKAPRLPPGKAAGGERR
jgi:hypothetical protein